MNKRVIRNAQIIFCCVFFLAMWLDLPAQVHRYTVAGIPWQEELGNHRTVLQLPKADNAVYVKINWRRQDQHAGQKRLIITNDQGVLVKNIFRIDVNREFAELLFEPISGPGKYYVYYFPWKGKKTIGRFGGEYLKQEETPDVAWVNKNDLPGRAGKWPVASILSMEARSAFNSFYPMEVIATDAEVKQLVSKKRKPLLLFPEDRKYPIRMKADIPYKWIKQGTTLSFSGTAMRDEYYTFQIGAFAAEREIKNLHIQYNISPFKITCFNTGGIDSKGNSFIKQINIPKGNVQALWFGIDIPANAKPGNYSFSVLISADGVAAQEITATIIVENKIIPERGDNELWRHSRLRWLNSTLGIDDLPIAPYAALRVDGKIIHSSTSKVAINEFGLPASIQSSGNQLLATPVNFIVETPNGKEIVQSSGIQFHKQTGGLVSWEAKAWNDRLKLNCTGSMESDGYIHYDIKVIPVSEIQVKDIRLELPVKKEMGQYFMGMGLPGTKTPASYNWKWKGPQDAFWIGDVHAGIHCELRGASYSGPLLNLYRPAPPPAWYNDNKGGFSIAEDKDAIVSTTYSGEKWLKKNDTLNFEFALLITPVKQVDSKGQFTNRYYHNGGFPIPKEDDLKTGIKIVNVHHANHINPYINYPFTTVDTIRSVVDTWHKKGMKVKLYYTTRELTNLITELWALRSLDTEILADGKGGGYVWLREHLIDHYDPQWFTTILGYEKPDAAIRTTGDSRWYNYYIEGLRWLIKHTGIDGLYLDDVSFDRNMLKRMRKVMNEVKPGCILDLHSNTGFSKGPATQYTEFFPYIDKLWFGESFQYDKMPAANWLVEVSGIPFGLMGDMLQGGGNPWRGMMYGMTVRYPWVTEGVTCYPQDIWKIWDEFGIADSKMTGYWENEKLVSTDNDNVLATTYTRSNRLMISLASWATDTVKVNLHIDWKKIGWEPDEAIIAPAIKNYQLPTTFKINDAIPVAPAKGWLLIFTKKSK